MYFRRFGRRGKAFQSMGLSRWDSAFLRFQIPCGYCKNLIPRKFPHTQIRPFFMISSTPACHKPCSFETCITGGKTEINPLTGIQGKITSNCRPFTGDRARRSRNSTSDRGVYTDKLEPGARFPAVSGGCWVRCLTARGMMKNRHPNVDARRRGGAHLSHTSTW